MKDQVSKTQGNLGFNQSRVIEETKIPFPVSKRDGEDSQGIPKFSVFNYPTINLPFKFMSSQEVYEGMKDYQKADREMFLLLFLDSKNNVIKIEPHTIGTVDSCAVYPREIFKSAILNSASSIICVHHHPSGNPEPSMEDRHITKQIVFAGELLGIKTLDHIILGDGKTAGQPAFFSFADEGLIEDLASEFKNSGLLK